MVSLSPYHGPCRIGSTPRTHRPTTWPEPKFGRSIKNPQEGGKRKSRLVAATALQLRTCLALYRVQKMQHVSHTQIPLSKEHAATQAYAFCHLGTMPVLMPIRTMMCLACVNVLMDTMLGIMSRIRSLLGTTMISSFKVPRLACLYPSGCHAYSPSIPIPLLLIACPRRRRSKARRRVLQRLHELALPLPY